MLEPRQLLAGIVAVDLGRLSGVSGNLADFQAADENLDSSTPFIRSDSSVGWSNGALDNTYDGLTFSTQAGDLVGNNFQASSRWTTDIPLIDSYTFGVADNDGSDELRLDISGFAARPAGETITLTVWGIGDNFGQQSAFTSSFGSASSSQETFYGFNNDGNGAVPFVQFTFTTDGTTDVLDLSVAQSTANGATQFTPVNGISLSVSESPLGILPGAHPVINEFSASNSNAINDDNGNSTDFIEIFNAGDTGLNLAGYTLTDDALEPGKYVFPSTTLASGQYLVVFAGDDADPTRGTDLYTGFGLSSSGEYLGFFDNAGDLVSEFGANGADFPAQVTDVSYGLLADGNFDTPSFFATPTPGGPNVNAVDGIVEPVDFSAEAGFYNAPFLLDFSTATPGAQIRVTTDGSTPTLTNGTDVTGQSILVNPVTTGSENIRAAAFKDGYLASDVETRTYLSAAGVVNQGENAPVNFPSTNINGQVFDYGIDPDVRAIEGDAAIIEALLSIQTVSITTDAANLFDEDTGIYTNALESGVEYEREASIELINPDGSDGFQVDAGLRIRGGFSRRDANPKHSFRIVFRSEYGDSELNYPLFGDEGTDTFDKLDFRTAQNYSYNLEGDPTNDFIHEYFSRQNQAEAGQPHTRSTWAHLYLNGEYWGLYQTQERVDSEFAASYLGGEPDDYDVIKVDAGIGAPRTIFASDGNLDAYNELARQTNAIDNDGTTPNFVNNDAYYKVQGLNPDGSRNLDYDALLDVDNLIDYITEILYSGNFDAPITNFGGNDSLNNFQAIRDRTGNEGFQFFVHDAEHAYRSLDRDRNGPYNDPIFNNSESSFNPQTLHQRLMSNAEYRVRFADSIQTKFFNDGIYATENVIARWDATAAEISSAIIAESARWGDSHSSRTRSPILKSDWEAAIANVRNNILANRGDVFLNQLRETIVELRDGNGNFTIDQDAPLFPSIDAPSFAINGSDQSGGEIQAGDSLTLSSTEAIYYTTDGTDPRDVGGGINSSAIAYDPSVSVSRLISSGSVWNYLDDGSDQGSAWRNASFNDSAWQSGNSELGYGDDDEATVVNEFGANGDKVVTTYFRHEFNVNQSFESATLSLLYDDGAVVYLNGNLVDIVNFGSITNDSLINFDTFANLAPNDGDNAEVDIDLTSFLVQGTNTLAIEIHQTSLRSSDISFDVQLDLFTQVNASSIPLTASTNIQARSFSNGEWSALHNASFVIPGSQSDLRISELHFNPVDPTPAEIAAGFNDNDDFEFIELVNPSTANSINLNGVQLSSGVTFDFGDVDLLPGERAVVVEDIDAFVARYGESATILGQWSGGLSNSGEEVTLLDSSMDEIMSVNYGDSDPWYNATDGLGFSLVLEDPVNTPVEELGKYYSWRASTEFGGTPGAASAATSGVVINEVLANSDAPLSDTIELFNSSGSAINVGGWYLSNDGGDLLKYQIPGGTIIAAGGYLVFDESFFNSSATGFALNGSEGDEVYLSRASGGTLIGLEDSVEFGATFNGESLGRLPNGTGRLTRLASTSFGSVNGDAEVGPLVISEVSYHPDTPTAAALAIDSTLTDNDLEYIEIANPTSSSIDLTNWRIRGEADYDFVAGTSLAPGQAIVVVSFDPSADSTKLAAFYTHYNIGEGVAVVGGLSASLSNSSGRVALQQPDAPDALGLVPHVVVDELVYDDLAPWGDADGSGLSLERDDLSANGTQPSSWVAVAPTPGVFESDFLLGDANEDGIVNLFDIAPFIAIITGGDYLYQADVNQDGVVNLFDIAPFIAILTAPQ